jgi:hypothetical protein
MRLERALVVAATSLLLIVIIIGSEVGDRGVVATAAKVQQRGGALIVRIFRGSVVATASGIGERGVVSAAAGVGECGGQDSHSVGSQGGAYGLEF